MSEPAQPVQSAPSSSASAWPSPQRRRPTDGGPTLCPRHHHVLHRATRGRRGWAHAVSRTTNGTTGGQPVGVCWRWLCDPRSAPRAPPGAPGDAGQHRRFEATGGVGADPPAV